MTRRSNKIAIKYNVKSANERLHRGGSAEVVSSGISIEILNSNWLYHSVFATKVSLWVVFLLCFSFLLQPVDRAFAEEIVTEEVLEPAVLEADPEPEATIEVVEEEPIGEQEVLEETEVVEESTEEPSEATDESVSEEAVDVDEENTVQVIDDSEEATGTEPVEDPLNEESTDDSASSTASGSESDEQTAQDQNDTNTPTATTTESTPETATSTESTATSSTTSESESSSGSGSSGSSGGSSSNDSDEDEAVESGNDESEEVSTSTNSGSDIANSDNDESVSGDENPLEDEVASTTATTSETVGEQHFVSVVESDSYFSFTRDQCTRIEDGTFYCQEPGSQEVLDDALLAAPDSDGDMEIFLVRAGVRTQITDNLVDDGAPYYDEYSNTLVWHRLINDRYQIISYDIESGVETQLTETRVNDMQPSRHGEFTVWQRWVENNWEIILFDGEKETQLTNSAQHDLAPNIRGPLVIWNTQSNDNTHTLKTYDIQNRTYTTIEDEDGVSVINPRMIVMYEAEYENGDIVTKGYDLVTGTIVPLQSLPREIPDEIPNSEPTSEVRAIIQQKPEPRESTVENSTPTTTPPTPPEPETTLNLRMLNTEQTTASTSETDLDLRATTTEETNLQENQEAEIPDVVIPPVIEDTEVASSTQIDQE